MTDEGQDSEPGVGSPERANWEWRTWRILFRTVLPPALNYRSRGVEHLPKGPALLLANHQSFLDPLLIGLPLRRPISYVARDDLFEAPIVGSILRRTYVMPIRQSSAASSIRVPIARLKQGFYVGLFPEGERTPDGEMLPLRPGFAALLRRAPAPVVPVGIAGAFEAWPRHRRLPRPGRVRVVFGKPVDLSPHISKGRERSMLEIATGLIQEVARDAAAWRSERSDDE